MDLKEALVLKKMELRKAQLEICRLNNRIDSCLKEIEGYKKGTASDATFQKQLSHIQGLNKKVSQLSRVADHYKTMYENEKNIAKEFKSKNIELEFENIELKNRLNLFMHDENTSENITALQDAEAQIKALKEEVARLNARLNNNSSNSGTPSSKANLDQKKYIPNSRVKSGKKKGGQPGHTKHEMKPFNDDEITEFIEHTLNECPECGSHNLEEISEQYKDEYDYEVKVVKRRNKYTRYRCLDCGEIVQVPIGKLKAPNQYGNTIQSLALSLMNTGFVSINRTRKILASLSPDPISICDGYLIKLQKRYSKKLRDFVDEIKNQLIGSPLLYWDDTVVFINTARACLRFYGNERIALYTAHMQKNLDGIIKDNILPSLSDATAVMHDHNTINYHEGFVFRNVECLQHLERDLQKLYEVSQHRWPMMLKNFISSKIHERKKLISEGGTTFSKNEIFEILNKVDSILKYGYQEYIKNLGHFYESEERALLNRLEKYKDNYFEWIKDFKIPTTNNLSERSLRFVKTKDKVSGQFQSIEYASYFADIRTYIETCSRNGIGAHDALLRLTSDIPYTVNELLCRD